MKMSDSDQKVYRNIYPDAVICDRMRLIGHKCDQLGPITIVYLKSPMRVVIGPGWSHLGPIRRIL